MLPDQLQGWLLKQKHGLYKAWTRRFFVLDGTELRYYRQEHVATPQMSIDLSHYTVVAQGRRRAFTLFSDDPSARPDYVLQAESSAERDRWVHRLEQHIQLQASVLDKWLERLDMHDSPTLAIASAPLRTQASVESFSSTLTATTSPMVLTRSCPSHTRSSFHTRRRPSSQSTHSNAPSSTTTASSSTLNSPASQKFFSSLLFSHWPLKSQRSPVDTHHPPLPDLPDMTFPDRIPPVSASPIEPIASPIILPSEYNHDDDPHERWQQRQQRENNVILVDPSHTL